MGKIRTRFIGDENLEEKQKKEQKIRAQEKKIEKKSAAAKAKEVKEKDKVEKEKVKGKNVETKTESKENEKVTEKKDKKEKKKSLVKQKARGKNYQDAKKYTDPKKQYEVAEAVELLKKISFAKFDESIELHLNVLNENMKGEVSLPHPTGKSIRIAIVDDKVLEQIEKGALDFDMLIAHPSYMPKIARFARILGPRGLMPNPKNGTLTPKPEETAKKFQAGALRWKTEPKAPLIHQMIGKKSHEPKALVENVDAFINSVGIKNILSAYIKSTMSPGLRLNLEKIVQ